MFRCEHCGRKMLLRRSFFSLFRPYVECPRCSTKDLGELSKPDRVDRTTRNPVRKLLRLFGAPLYHCTFCRYQFSDWRPIAPRGTAN